MFSILFFSGSVIEARTHLRMETSTKGIGVRACIHVTGPIRFGKEFICIDCIDACKVVISSVVTYSVATS